MRKLREASGTTSPLEGLVRNDHPPLTMTGPGMLNDQDGNSQTLKSKPDVIIKDVKVEMENRMRILRQRAKDEESGKKPVGMADLKKQSQVMYFGPGDKSLCAWGSEDKGWKTVECILDSGASESVCPPSMAPRWPIQDSPGSKV